MGNILSLQAGISVDALQMIIQVPVGEMDYIAFDATCYSIQVQALVNPALPFALGFPEQSQFPVRVPSRMSDPFSQVMVLRFIKNPSIGISRCCFNFKISFFRDARPVRLIQIQHPLIVGFCQGQVFLGTVIDKPVLIYLTTISAGNVQGFIGSMSPAQRFHRLLGTLSASLPGDLPRSG